MWPFDTKCEKCGRKIPNGALDPGRRWDSDMCGQCYNKLNKKIVAEMWENSDSNRLEHLISKVDRLDIRLTDRLDRVVGLMERAERRAIKKKRR
jgi:IS1 family transposase